MDRRALRSADRLKATRNLRAQVIVAAAAIMVALAAAEGALRWLGRAPIVRRTAWSASTFAADDRLGYVVAPGASDIEVRAGSLVETLRVTRLEGGRRITRPLSEYANAPARPQVWVLGCSFTFGVMLADEQTFPWIAQTQLPEYEVVNFAVPGYSTLQMLMRLEAALQQPGRRPEVVVLAYATFHEERNVCSRAWRTAGGLPYSYPCARPGPDGTPTRIMIQRGEAALPFADRLAIVGTLESAIDHWDEARFHASDVTERLIADLVALCRREHIRVAIADVFEDGRGLPMLRRFAADGVPVLAIAPNYQAPGMTFAPFDPHPAPAGARWLGEHLASGLRETVLR